MCQRITNAIKFILEKLGHDTEPYLDDFGVVSPPEAGDASFVALGQVLLQSGAEEALSPAQGRGSENQYGVHGYFV